MWYISYVPERDKWAMHTNVNDFNRVLSRLAALSGRYPPWRHEIWVSREVWKDAFSAIAPLPSVLKDRDNHDEEYYYSMPIYMHTVVFRFDGYI